MALSSDNTPTCAICGDTEILTVFTPNNVYCQCTNGHHWREQYQDQGGDYPRPTSPVRRLEDLLTPAEVKLYQHLIEEIAKDIEYYLNADPAEKAKRLSDKCKTDQSEIILLFKKITLYQNITKGGQS